MNKYKRNVDLDATLVHAAMAGLFVPCAIQLGLSPDEAFGRSLWLKRQPKSYVDKVVNKVMEIQDKEAQK